MKTALLISILAISTASVAQESKKIGTVECNITAGNNRVGVDLYQTGVSVDLFDSVQNRKNQIFGEATVKTSKGEVNIQISQFRNKDTGNAGAITFSIVGVPNNSLLQSRPVFEAVTETARLNEYLVAKGAAIEMTPGSIAGKLQEQNSFMIVACKITSLNKLD